MNRVDPHDHCRDCNTFQYLDSTLADNAIVAVSCSKSQYSATRKLCPNSEASSLGIALYILTVSCLVIRTIVLCRALSNRLTSTDISFSPYLRTDNLPLKLP
jgi:hypothetical protein